MIDRLMQSLLNRDTKEFWHGLKSQHGSHGNSKTVISVCSFRNDICEGFVTSLNRILKIVMIVLI